MISKIKKPVSILLSLIMVFSVFAIIPFTASASSSASYVKVTSEPTNWAGEYLIVYEDQSQSGVGVVFDSTANLSTGSNKLADSYTINNGAIASVKALDDVKVTIAKIDGTNNYSIKTANGDYIGKNDNANGLNTNSSALSNSIVLDGDSVKITSSGGAIMRYNTGSSQFRYYKSATYTNQKPIQLYKLGNAAASTYTVTWKNGNDVIENDENVEEGSLPSYDGEVPTKDEDNANTYEFAGWSDGETTYGLNDALPEVTGDVTYTAVFSSAKRKYTVTWKNDDGTVIDTTTVAYGDTPTHNDIEKPEDEQYTYTFVGWTPEVIPVTGDADYIATFEANKKPVADVYEIINGKYYVNGELVKGAGLIKLDDNYYYIKQDGQVFTGSVYIPAANTNDLFPAGNYKFDTDGKMVVYDGIVDGRYYVDGAAVKGVGMIEIDGDYYFLKENGAFITDASFLVTEAKANGLVSEGNYHFDADGKMEYRNGVVSGKYYIDNVLTKGVGLVQFNGDIYYVKQNGYVFTGGVLNVPANMTNGLATKGSHRFDADGKFVH